MLVNSLRKTLIVINVILIAFFISSNLLGQTIKGRITDNTGEGIPYASVFVKELSLGAASNIDGNFSINVPVGTYTLVFQSLGFNPETRSVEIEKGTVTLDILLEMRVYNLAAVKITTKAEDPAYNVMRKAIAMAPYYIRQVNSYEASVYIKGSARVNKLSRLVKRQLRKEEDAPKEGESYVYESQNSVIFKAPNKYEQKVIAARSTFPGIDGNMSIGFLTTSFYQPTFTAFISPLAPNAFSHYNYKYLGSSVENDKFIHRIQFSPKRKNAKLISGTLHIVSALYCLHSLDVSGAHFPGKFNLKVQFAEVKQNVWMPVSQNLDVDIKALGNSGEASYITSVKYSKLIVDNKELALSSTLNAENKPTTEQTVSAKKPKTKREVKKKETLEKLMEKEELTNREMAKLASLIESESKDTTKSLELERRNRIKIDSLAYKRDTVKWEQIRPVPLQEHEFKSFQKRDSLISKIKTDTLSKKAKKEYGRRHSFANVMLTGGYYRTENKKWWLSTEGIYPLDQTYNTVDGFTPGYSFTMGFLVPKLKKTIRNGVEAAYSISRRELLGNISLGFPYNPARRGYFVVYGNYGSRNYNWSNGIHPFANCITSLFFRQNPLRLYHEKQLTIRNSIDLANGLVLSAAASTYKRDTLNNTKNYSFFYNSERQFSPNIPENGYFDQSLKTVGFGSQLSVLINYTPRYYYRMYEKYKQMVKSDYPTFSLSATVNHYGANVGFSPTRLEFGARQTIDLSVFRKFSYNVKFGSYVGGGKLHFADFKHFNTQPLWVVLNEKDETFMHLPFYGYSTKGSWAQANVAFSAPFIAIKYLPFFSNMIWNEGLFLNTLKTSDLKWYAEVGYGVAEILGSFKISGYAGFMPSSKPLYGFRIGYTFSRGGVSFP
jgi:hypothetical protein